MKAILSVLELGTQYTQNKPEAFRLQMVNLFLLISIAVTIINTTYFLLNDIYPVRFILLLYSTIIPFSIILWVHSKGNLYLGGILATVIPFLTILLAYIASGSDTNYSLFFLVMSISPAITIYKNGKLTLCFFLLYMSMFFLASILEFPSLFQIDEIAKDTMDSFIYALSTIVFTIFSMTIYHFNSLGFLELQDREQKLLHTKQALEKSNRLKSAFLANMSHEIRTPMNGILGFSKLLTQEALSEEQQKYASIIHQSSGQLLNVVNDVLDISKIETGQIEVVEETLHLGKLMEELQLLFGHVAAKKDLELSYTCPPHTENLSIKTDAQKVRQILTNLLSNALKFTEQGSVSFGFIRLADKKEVEFFVRDTGIGIAKEHQSKIFDRFQQIEQGKKNVIKGTGLGLSICKAFADLLQATLSIDSNTGRGTTFLLRLPYRTATDVYVAQKTLVSPNTIKRACTILLAEDVHFNTILVQKLLENTDVQLHCVNNGRLAVEFALHHPELELILMDIKMPDMDGRSAMKAIKAFRPDLPIVALTAFVMNEERIALQAEGFDGFATKPIQREALVQTINQLLDVVEQV